MSDFGDDQVDHAPSVSCIGVLTLALFVLQYVNMICVEAGHVASRVSLPPQQTFSGGQTITLQK